MSDKLFRSCLQCRYRIEHPKEHLRTHYDKCNFVTENIPLFPLHFAFAIHSELILNRGTFAYVPRGGTGYEDCPAFEKVQP